MAQFIDFGTGKEGSLTISAANLGGVGGFGVATFTGTAGQTSGTFSDVGYFNGSNGGRVGDMVLIHQSQGTGAGQWEVQYILSRSGTTINFTRPLTYTYTTGAQIQSAPQLYNGTISGSLGVYNAWGGSSGGIIFLVDKGTLTVSGSISVNGANGNQGNNSAGSTITGGGFYGGYYRGACNTTGGQQGAGTIGMGSESSASNGNGGGAGKNINGGFGRASGAGGGNGSAGTNGAYTGDAGRSSGGTAGAAAGNAGLTNMVFGGGGGGGMTTNTAEVVAAGGSGGGIVLIIAKTITLVGSITVNGGNAGTANGDYMGGGGGAGGSVLIKAQIATLGTNKITASGGTTSRQGGTGGVGRIHIDYYSGYTGTTTPTIDAAQDTNLKSTVYTSMI